MATIAIGDVHGNLALRDAASAAGAELYLTRCALPYDLFFNVVPEAHLAFFEGLWPYCQTPDCICVHGGLNPKVLRIEDQPVDALIWHARWGEFGDEDHPGPIGAAI